MKLYGLTIFISAILLFQVQLIIAKYILPWFGGTPAVWSTCMLFFQVLLTGGYAYSHGIVSKLTPRRQSNLHISLLGASLLLIILQVILWASPLLPSSSWKPIGSDMPILRILGMLTVAVGLPFFILSSTSSLLQAWFSRTFPNRSPYKLFALSNVGSLLGLLSYPFIVEPNSALSTQANIWFVVYIVFAVCCGITAFKAGKVADPDLPEDFSSVIDEEVQENTGNGDTTWLQRTLWLALTAGASIVLLATTNQVSEEVAVIPFLWVLPLSIYLFTFVLSFSSRYLYWRPVYVIAGIVALFFVGQLLFQMLAMITGDAYGASIFRQIAVYYVALFVLCMLCHGELVRLRPRVKHLTQFYLSVSIGGALGGVFVGLVAPQIFNGLWELYIGYFISGLAVLIAIFRDRKSLVNVPVWGWFLRIPAVALIILLAVGPYFLLVDRLPQTYRDITIATADFLGIKNFLPMGDANEKTIAINRNFYGILRVVETYPNDEANHIRYLYHGQTLHGFQFMSTEYYRSIITTYFTKESGIAKAITNHPRYNLTIPRKEQMRVGIVGLGAGTLAGYGKEGDYYRIYEINPAMADVAASENGYFRYVPDSKAEVDVIMGDARISMENEEPQRFDVLALDAFSGDAPPVHLLTREAFGLYLQHIREGGIIAVHITNRYLNFKPLIWNIAEEMGLEKVLISSWGDDWITYYTDWFLLAKDKNVLNKYVFTSKAAPLIDAESLENTTIWTDDYSNLYQLLY